MVAADLLLKLARVVQLQVNLPNKSIAIVLHIIPVTHTQTEVDYLI